MHVRFVGLGLLFQWHRLNEGTIKVMQKRAVVGDAAPAAAV